MVNLNAERGGNINNRKRKTRTCKSRRIKTKRVKITKKSATRSFNRKGTKKLRKKRKMKGGDEGDDVKAAEDAKANIKGVFKARFIKQLYKNVLTLCGKDTEHLNNYIDVTKDDVDKYIVKEEWGYTLVNYNSQQKDSIRDDIKKYLIANANSEAYKDYGNRIDNGTSDTGTSNTNCATLNSGKNIDNLPEKNKEPYSEQKGSLTIRNRFQTGRILQGLQLEAVNELFNINTDIMPTSEELHNVYQSFIRDRIPVSHEPPIKYDNDCSCWMKEVENVADIMKKKPSTPTPTELLKFCIRRINTIFDENIPLDTGDDFARIYNRYVTRIIELYEENNGYKESEVWWRERVSDELKGRLDKKKISISNSSGPKNNFNPPISWIEHREGSAA
jgi:hypothetical protein